MSDEEKMTLGELKRYLRLFETRYLTTSVVSSGRQAAGIRGRSRDTFCERRKQISTRGRCHSVRSAGAEGGFRSVGDPDSVEHYGVSRNSLSSLIPHHQTLSRLPVVEPCLNSVLSRRGVGWHLQLILVCRRLANLPG